jgi:hypothetical protein
VVVSPKKTAFIIWISIRVIFRHNYGTT